MWDNKVLKQKAQEHPPVPEIMSQGIKRRHSMMITMRMHSFPEEILIRT